MQPAMLTLIHDLAEAIALRDPELTFAIGTALAERIGREAATALAQALAAETRPLSAILQHMAEPVQCA